MGIKFFTYISSSIFWLSISSPQQLIGLLTPKSIALVPECIRERPDASGLELGQLVELWLFHTGSREQQSQLPSTHAFRRP